MLLLRSGTEGICRISPARDRWSGPPAAAIFLLILHSGRILRGITMNTVHPQRAHCPGHFGFRLRRSVMIVGAVLLAMGLGGVAHAGQRLPPRADACVVVRRRIHRLLRTGEYHHHHRREGADRCPGVIHPRRRCRRYALRGPRRPLPRRQCRRQRARGRHRRAIGSLDRLSRRHGRYQQLHGLVLHHQPATRRETAAPGYPSTVDAGTRLRRRGELRDDRHPAHRRWPAGIPRSASPHRSSNR